MNTIKIGKLLKELRKEKQLTQEQLAEYLNVSRRTVSRWETGSNLPDLDLLIELSDYYKVDLRDLINGQRSISDNEEHIEDTVKKIADYSAQEQKERLKIYHILFLMGCFLFCFYFLLRWLDLDHNPIVEFIEGFCMGVSFGLFILGAVVTSLKGRKLYSKLSANTK